MNKTIHPKKNSCVLFIKVVFHDNSVYLCVKAQKALSRVLRRVNNGVPVRLEYVCFNMSQHTKRISSCNDLNCFTGRNLIWKH